MAPAAEEREVQNAAQTAFPKLFKFREVVMQVSLVTISRPVAPLPCLLLDMKDLLKEDARFFDGRVLIGWLQAACEAAYCCVSPPEQLSAWRTLYIGVKKVKLKKS
jgi:hypothetical protein